MESATLISSTPMARYDSVTHITSANGTLPVNGQSKLVLTAPRTRMPF